MEKKRTRLFNISNIHADGKAGRCLRPRSTRDKKKCWCETSHWQPASAITGPFPPLIPYQERTEGGELKTLQSMRMSSPCTTAYSWRFLVRIRGATSDSEEGVGGGRQRGGRREITTAHVLPVGRPNLFSEGVGGVGDKLEHGSKRFEHPDSCREQACGE